MSEPGGEDGFSLYLNRWRLTVDGAPIHTHSSDLLPVRLGEEPAMLKIPRDPEERRGSKLMEWWGGQGAARVLAKDEDAILLERLEGLQRLAQMSRAGQDGEADRILCQVAARLHTPRSGPLPPLHPLDAWFASLRGVAPLHGGVLAEALLNAEELLASRQDVRVLHGDIHHGNVLDGGERGWVAIDPKGLIGERGFDFANLFHNPDPDRTPCPGRFAKRLQTISAAAGLEPRRLLQWILAYSGLSAAWTLEDGADASPALEIARLAAAELACQ